MTAMATHLVGASGRNRRIAQGGGESGVTSPRRFASSSARSNTFPRGRKISGTNGIWAGTGAARPAASHFRGRRAAGPGPTRRATRRRARRTTPAPPSAARTCRRAPRARRARGCRRGADLRERQVPPDDARDEPEGDRDVEQHDPLAHARMLCHRSPVGSISMVDARSLFERVGRAATAAHPRLPAPLDRA